MEQLKSLRVFIITFCCSGGGKLYISVRRVMGYDITRFLTYSLR